MYNRNEEVGARMKEEKEYRATQRGEHAHRERRGREGERKKGHRNGESGEEGKESRTSRRKEQERHPPPWGEKNKTPPKRREPQTAKGGGDHHGNSDTTHGTVSKNARRAGTAADGTDKERKDEDKMMIIAIGHAVSGGSANGGPLHVGAEPAGHGT